MIHVQILGLRRGWELGWSHHFQQYTSHVSVGCSLPISASNPSWTSWTVLNPTNAELVFYLVFNKDSPNLGIPASTWCKPRNTLIQDDTLMLDSYCGTVHLTNLKASHVSASGGLYTKPRAPRAFTSLDEKCHVAQNRDKIILVGQIPRNRLDEMYDKTSWGYSFLIPNSLRTPFEKKRRA